MDRHEFLGGVHAVLRPRSYLEIGVNDGRSLSLSRTRSIAVDPAFRITTEQHCDLHLVKATSDDFFARRDTTSILEEGGVDFAFIDGLHLFEYALRDFINVERHSTWTSVIVFDDVLPRSLSEAARDRHTREWAGDVYKVAEVLRRYRPDLVCLPLDTEPTGVLLVLGANSNSTTLQDHYDDIVAEFVVDDPQSVPPDVLLRRGSVDPQAALAAPSWALLVAARDAGAPRDSGAYEAMLDLLGTGPVRPVVPPGPNPWPARSAAPPAAAAAPPRPPRPQPSVRRASRELARAVQRSARRRLGR